MLNSKDLIKLKQEKTALNKNILHYYEEDGKLFSIVDDIGHILRKTFSKLVEKERGSIKIINPIYLKRIGNEWNISDIVTDILIDTINCDGYIFIFSDVYAPIHLSYYRTSYNVFIKIMEEIEQNNFL